MTTSIFNQVNYQDVLSSKKLDTMIKLVKGNLERTGFIVNQPQITPLTMVTLADLKGCECDEAQSKVSKSRVKNILVGNKKTNQGLLTNGLTLHSPIVISECVETNEVYITSGRHRTVVLDLVATLCGLDPKTVKVGVIYNKYQSMQTILDATVEANRTRNMFPGELDKMELFKRHSITKANLITLDYADLEDKGDFKPFLYCFIYDNCVKDLDAASPRSERIITATQCGHVVDKFRVMLDDSITQGLQSGDKNLWAKLKTAVKLAYNEGCFTKPPEGVYLTGHKAEVERSRRGGVLQGFFMSEIAK